MPRVLIIDDDDVIAGALYQHLIDNADLAVDPTAVMRCSNTMITRLS